MKHIYALLLPLLFCLPARGQQSLAKLERDFLYGKGLLKENKYSQSAMVFNTLAQEKADNPFLPYARYFEAYSNYKQDKFFDAKNLLESLLQEGQDWDKKEDAICLLGTVYCELGKIDEALAQFAQVRGYAFKETLPNTKKYFLSSYPTERLAQLNTKYPEDREIAEILTAKLGAAAPGSKEHTLRKQLSDKFGFGIKEEVSVAVQERPVKKDAYKVGVFMPFDVTEFDVSSSYRKNQFVYDIQTGIELAVKQLEKEGIKIELFSFDTKKSDVITRGILADKAISQLDMIIGPLYKQDIAVVDSFASVHNIPVINPLTNKQSTLESTQSLFLMQPGAKTQAIKAAAYAKALVPQYKRACIIYGSTIEDSVMASAYKECVERDGGQVLVHKQFAVGGRSYGDLINQIAKNARKDSLMHYFVPVTDESMAVSIVSAIYTSRGRGALITTNEWLNFSQVKYDQLEKLNAVFMSPGYVDPLRDKVKAFNQMYFDEIKLIPSKYSYMGFETMYVFGKSLWQNGTGMKNALMSATQTDALLYEKVSYKNSRDNQELPFLRFKDGSLDVITSTDIEKGKRD